MRLKDNESVRKNAPVSVCEGVSRDTVVLRLRPRACLSGDLRPPPVYIALRATVQTCHPYCLMGQGSGTLPGSAKLFQVGPGSRPALPAAPGVSGGARSDDPNRMSRPTPERRSLYFM